GADSPSQFSGANKKMTSSIDKTYLSLSDMIIFLAGIVTESMKLEKCQQDIVKKFGIDVDKDGLWKLTDVQKVWSKVRRMRNKTDKTRWSLTVLAEMRKREKKNVTDAHDRSIKKEKENVRALAELKQEREEELKKIKNELSEMKMKTMIVTDVSSVPPPLYPHAELKQAAKQSHTWYEEDLPGWGSSETEEEEIMNVRPIKSKLMRGLDEGRSPLMVYSHKAASPKQLDEWSKLLKHPREVGSKTWDQLKRYRTLYNLHPFDATQLLGFILNNREHADLADKVKTALGEDKQDLIQGWRAIQRYLKSLTIATTNWGEITKCVQKPKESFFDFEDRFRAVVIRHSGMCDDDDELNNMKNGAITHQLLQSINDDLRKAYVSTTPGWDIISYGDTADHLSRLDRDMNQHTATSMVRVMQLQDAFDKNSIKCHKCGKFGHFLKDCGFQPRRQKRRNGSNKGGWTKEQGSTSTTLMQKFNPW
uniref:CCHC-type domain-containing protein n=1 Tax=Esox lucius TaxID=8010 RepID=A0AAY5KWV5_ESOLU